MIYRRNVALPLRRQFQTCTARLFSPYRFYDLARAQPTLSELERFKQETLELKVSKAAATDAAKDDPHLKTVMKARELSPQERARIVFGSRLAGPARRAALESTYRNILGVKVPSRPTEPDNCCMSGCVNCVWELYRDDFEDWQDRKRKAMKKLIDNNRLDLWPADFGDVPNLAKGSATVDESKEEEDAFKDVDVGIRVFIETERRLKKKHAKQYIIPPQTANPSANLNA
ncbi:oxidoreductase-like protein [Lipomyces arxii]|uniref:oxidoreductase-like protein n=1 Tax=Lipomyces arxii TaxID=56418 RepID=UPI0034CE78D8